jgi:hypothetical protein
MMSTRSELQQMKCGSGCIEWEELRPMIADSEGEVLRQSREGGRRGADSEGSKDLYAATRPDQREGLKCEAGYWR